ncbi:glycerate kinase [Antrihabitans sp. YC3-6]|uniref:Glycerate kinase n=1 Tax=Antrihabitans stalagmiti TaxID=2799499 RepID=A0A934U5F0_9NOCA|nr:glycerate kinase [Antrihabitans stalagmiti]MBJ8340773.1 glycerate kinase [Antrihabitans stalagmiti]
MHVLIAPDKFKGSLTAAEVADALAAGIADAGCGWTTVQLPIADGGDGTVAAAVANGWTPVGVSTTGPTGRPLVANYAVRGDRAVVELASAVGLDKLPGRVPDPLGASTFGLGTVIAHALDHGAKDIVVGIGGSASTDGGAGLLQALGARVVDADGGDVGPGGGQLLRAVRLDLADLHPAVRETRFRVACDVDNPLLGSHGATAVYGPQKGATSSDLLVLEAAMSQWAQVVTAAVGTDVAGTPGSGAAGGTGFALFAVLDAVAHPGIELVLELVDFESYLADADLVITGEGCLDNQTLHGKAPAGVAAAARRRGVPVLAVAGRSLLTAEALLAAGITRAYPLSELEPDPETSIANAAALLRKLGPRIVEEHTEPSITTRQGAAS